MFEHLNFITSKRPKTQKSILRNIIIIILYKIINNSKITISLEKMDTEMSFKKFEKHLEETFFTWSTFGYLHTINHWWCENEILSNIWPNFGVPLCVDLNGLTIKHLSNLTTKSRNSGFEFELTPNQFRMFRMSFHLDLNWTATLITLHIHTDICTVA